MTLKPQRNFRFSRQAGIAIGPILFILAMLAVIGLVMSAGNGEFSQAGVIDRIAADVATQATLIRTKINECNVKWGTNGNYDGYPSSLDVGNNAVPTLVSNLNCSGDSAGAQNLWSGARPLMLPPPTSGFNPWYYVNTVSPNSVNPCSFNGNSCLGGTPTGGRCITIAPTNPSASSKAYVAGLTRAASKFTHATANDGASEVNYNPASSTQRFVLWITVPAAGSEDNNCKP